MQKAVAYYRYSSDMQTEYSIEGQREAVQRYAKQHNISIIKEYIDREKSGRTDIRPQFLEMIHDLKKGIVRVEYVLWHKFDRYARNRTDAAIYRREIRRLGIKPIAVDQPLDPDNRPEDIILESLLDGMAEYYSRNLAIEIMKGLKVRAKECKFTGGYVPYGFSIEDKKYTINEAEAPAIRMIFEMAHRGVSYRNICDQLETAGYKTRRGKRFAHNAIHDTLRNKKYAGIYTFNETSRRSPDGSRNWKRKKPEEKQIVIPGGIPAIVSEELFFKVQKMLDTRKQRVNPRQKEKGVIYMLTGKTYCGDCGTLITGTSSTARKGGEPYRYYMCSDKQRLRKKSKCSSTRWPKERTEEAILREIRVALTKPDLAEYLFRLYKEKNKRQDEQQDTILKEIQSLTDRTNRLLDMVENGLGDMTAASERINQYTLQKKELEHELAQSASPPQFTVKHFRDYLDHVSVNEDLRLHPHQAKKIIDTYVEKIILYPDNRVEVILKINVPTGGSSGNDNISYNSGAEGASLTYTHKFSLP